MSGRVKTVIIVALTIILTAFIGILGNAVILPSFIKNNPGFIWLLLGICVFTLIYLEVRPQLVQQSETPSSRAKQPGEERFLRLSLNASLNGIISLGVILLIIGVAFLRGWNIAWWYFVSTILSYILFLLFHAHLESSFLAKSLFSSSEDKRNTTVTIGPFSISRANKVQLWISAHLTLILLVGGLWLRPSKFLEQAGIFVGAVIVGGGIPFIVPFIVRHLSNLKPSTPPAVAGRLVVVDSGLSYLKPGTEFNLAPRTTIGRGPANTIQIHEGFLSSENTRMLFRKGIWYVQDAGSSYGTRVNDKPAHDALETHWGDIIQVGFIRFQLLAPPPVSVQPSVAGCLVVVDGGPSRLAPGTEFNLTPRTPIGTDPGGTTIGRGPANTIQIHDTSLSTEHTRMLFRESLWYVQDAGSASGTYVNGKPARAALEAHWGDTIQVGSIRFQLLASPPGPAQPSVNAEQAQPVAASVHPSVPVLPLLLTKVNQPPAELTIRILQGKQETYRIEKPVIKIGRQLDNDIIVEDKRTSRYHAQIKFESNGQFTIYDLGTTNGITVNGTPNQRQHILHNGDHFTIGSYDFSFQRR